MELVRAHSFLARCHQVKRERPFPIGNVTAFHHTAHLDREWFAACITLVEAPTMRLAGELGSAFPDRSAMRTNRTMRPADRLEMLARRVLVSEDRIGEVESLGHGLTP
jgi:hypothetical protein